jgi:hypothetical protein
MRTVKEEVQEGALVSGIDEAELQELFLGTWTSMALIVESLIKQALLPRSELLQALQDAQALARDRRRTAIAGVRLLIQRLGSCDY